MSQDRRIAAGILAKASSAVGKERVNHGDVMSSFTAIAEAWAVYINAVNARRTGLDTMPPIHLDARDVALMMSDVKKYRAVFGDEANPDNYVDNAGYTALAGMMMLPDGASSAVQEQIKTDQQSASGLGFIKPPEVSSNGTPTQTEQESQS